MQVQTALQTNPELIAVLNRKYQSDYQKQQSTNRIIQTCGGVCYNVSLGGKLGTVCAGTSKAAPQYSFNLSNYPFHRIVFTISGQVQVYAQSRRQIAEPGSIYYFPPKKQAIVTNISSEIWKLIYVHFTGTEAAKLMSKIAASSTSVWNISNPGLVQALFENIASASLEQTEDAQVICDCYLRILLTRLASMTAQGSEHLSPSRLKYLDCYNYISHNFSDIGSIEQISKRCNISSIYLCRLFKKYARSTPMAYVAKLKMNKAAILLMQTDYSIKQISIILAFSDPYYFSKAFKRVYGVSPKKYRESH